jgi:hypothetical protein
MTVQERMIFTIQDSDLKRALGLSRWCVIEGVEAVSYSYAPGGVSCVKITTRRSRAPRKLRPA